MSLELLLPPTGKPSIKQLVFTILAKEYPLKQVELFNYIRKRYGRAVTYQAVRKTIKELLEENILTEKNRAYQINTEWVNQSLVALQTLSEELNRGPRQTKDRLVAGTVTVYEFDSLQAMMTFWEQLIDDWLRAFKVGDPNTNFYQAHHAWEGLTHLDQERKMMGKLVEKGIRSVTLLTGSTGLDLSIRNFYQSIGVKTYIRKSNTQFDRGYHVGTYGDLVVHTTIPPSLVNAIDAFFHRHQTIETLNIHELSKIIARKTIVKLTVIKDAQMAKHLNQSILSQVNS